MSMGNTAELNLGKLIFNNTTWANVGDATGIVGSTAAGSLYVSLHTADPGEGGDQTTSEAGYTSYARVAVARTSGGWTASANPVVNAATITFPTCTGSSSTCTHWAIGRASTLAGEIICSGALTNTVVVSVGNPIATFAAGALTITFD